MAIGILEIVGLTAAVEALDAMVKTSNVEFYTWEKKLGGRLVTVVVRGEVSAVEAALENGKIRAARLGRVAASAMISRPHEEIIKMLNISAAKLGSAKSGEINAF